MREAPPRPRAVEARLAHALVAAAAAVGIAVRVGAHRARSWASATFEGARHDVILVAPRSPGLGGWVAALPDAELPLHRHLVASLAVETIEDDGATVRLTLSVLTIEDR